MRMQSLIVMVCVLAVARRRTVQQLADPFQVSRMTVFRDLSTLSRMGIPIVSCQTAGEDAAAVKEYAVDMKNFSRDETLRIIGAFHESGENHKENPGDNEKGGEDCPCKRDCRYHGDCKACVAVHRTRKKCVPDCLRPGTGKRGRG